MTNSQTTRLRWQEMLYDQNQTRWSQPEIDQLKRELNRLSRKDSFFKNVADCIGSLEFDLVDARMK